jgi:hypothetical protein
MGTSISRNPGTIVFNVANAPGIGPNTGGDRGVVMADGGILDLSPNSLDSIMLGLGGSGIGASAFDQAQQMDFDGMVANSVANPTQITKQDYDQLIAEVGAVQRNPLLSAQDRVNAISNLLTSSEIFHDPNSLDVLGGSDAGGLLSKRIQIVPDTAGGADSDSASDDSIADVVAAVNNQSGADAVIGALDTDSVASLDVTNYGSVYLGDGQFQDRVTGEITVQEGAAENSFYQVGNIYGYEGPLGEDGLPLSPTGEGGINLTVTLGGGGLNSNANTGAATDTMGGDPNGSGNLGNIDLGNSNTSNTVTTTVVGPQGVPGTPGTQGPQGEQGLQGEQGPAGTPGATGATGAAGAQGEQGEQGERGLTGARGAPGASAISTTPLTDALFGRDLKPIEIDAPLLTALKRRSGWRSIV